MQIKHIIFFFLLASSVSAHHKIYSPRVEEGRQSLEWRGHFDIDERKSMESAHHHVFETEYSWTNFWQSEIELHISDKQDSPLDWEKTELQNQMQIFDYQNFAGAIYFSYNFVSESDEADEIEYKYLNEFASDSISLISNFIFEKQIGEDAESSTEFALSNYIVFKKLVYDFLDFGFIGFSEFGELNNIKVFSEQKHQYGLQFESTVEFNDFEFDYSLGYLHGFTDASADGALIWNFEIEF